MSKPRYKWWSYVRWMVRLYPERMAELRRRQDARITPNYAPQMPHGNGPNRTTEELGTVSLGRVVDREIEAVRRAMEETASLPNGDIRLQIIDAYHWKRTHTLDGASLAAGVSERTGRAWNGEFIYAVAKYFELTDDLHPEAKDPGYDDTVES